MSALRRVLEIFYLKLRMLDEAVAAVARAGQAGTVAAAEPQRRELSRKRGHAQPNAPGILDRQGFAGQSGRRAGRSRPRLPERPHFLAAAAEDASPYQLSGGKPGRGRRKVSLTSVSPEVAGLVVIEGTFIPDQRLEEAEDGLAWMRFTLGDKGVSLYALADTRGVAEGAEIAFRSLACGSRLPSPPGSSPRWVRRRRMPSMNSCLRSARRADLYALGVLAIRTLILNDATDLPSAIAAFGELAVQLKRFDPAAALPRRIQTIFDEDEQWFALLGSHRVAPRTGIRLPADRRRNGPARALV